MRLIRFMGAVEQNKYLNGETLTNITDWRKAGQRSGSRGFCFFDDSETPEERLPYVSGVVDTSLVAVFDTVPFARLELMESLGTYRDTERDLPTLKELLTFSNLQFKKVREYSALQYNSQILHIVKVGRPERHPEGWRIDWGERHEQSN